MVFFYDASNSTMELNIEELSHENIESRPREKLHEHQAKRAQSGSAHGSAVPVDTASKHQNSRQPRGARNIGLKRARSKALGQRESTPDQDDMRPVEEEEEALDIDSVLQITMAREAKIREDIEERIDEDSDEGPSRAYDSDRDEGYVSFAGQATFSMHSRKEAKKSRRPKFERSKDAIVHIGSLTRAGDAGEAGVGANEAGGSFVDVGVSSLLSSHMAKHGYHVPTPIQRKSIPFLLVRS